MTFRTVVAGFFFVFFLSFVCFSAGMFIGSFLVPEGSGLAGPAILLGYGVLGLGLGLVVSLILLRILPKPLIAKLRAVFGILTFLVIGWLVYRFITLQRENKADATHLEAQPRLLKTRSVALEEGEAMGLGLVFPRIADGEKLYFYSPQSASVLAHMVPPVDSLVFGAGPHYVDIATAPPWFVPEYMKLDYDLLFLRAITLHTNWVEVVVNRLNGETRWVDRQAVEYVGWPAFLLGVHSVEAIDPSDNLVRHRPFNHADPIAEDVRLLSPLAVRQDWMQVGRAEADDPGQAVGWVRWHDGQKLLITYSPLN